MKPFLAVHTLNLAGTTPVILTCPHASNAVPPVSRQLGLSEEQLMSHRGYDPGAAELTHYLARQLDAPAFLGTVSRLWVELNRKVRNPAVRDFTAPADLVAPRWEFEIPGNQNVTDADRAARYGVHRDFHMAVHHAVAIRAGSAPMIVDVHTFNPAIAGMPKRDYAIGLLGPGRGTPESPMVTALLKGLRDRFVIGDMTDYLQFDPGLSPPISKQDAVRWNQPYDLSDPVCIAAAMMPAHAMVTSPPLDYVCLEVRNDVAGHNHLRRSLCAALREVAGGVRPRRRDLAPVPLEAYLAP